MTSFLPVESVAVRVRMCDLQTLIFPKEEEGISLFFVFLLVGSKIRCSNGWK